MEKKRKDCFFGLHFDAHASKDAKYVGKDFNSKGLEKLFGEVKPDFVQCDSKGHPGVATFQTEYGTSVKFYTDTMREWRRISEENGALLFAHYSGLFDMDAVQTHPEWAFTDKDGNKNCEYASVFGPYVDKKLIPQLKELAGKYSLDGVWMDGECWGAYADHAPFVEKAFEEKTGTTPKEDSDGFTEYCRQGFRDYVAHYIEEVKKEYPDFEIASNWMCSSLMPELPPVPVDFISGDLSPTDSVNSARKEARLLAGMGKPWDLMAWGFSYPVHYVKGVEQLEQEAAMVISHGGGFQVYEKQDLRYGMSDFWAIPDLVEIANFCRDRKEYCWRSTSVNDACVVYSTKAYYVMNGERLFGPYGKYNDDLDGVLNNMLDNGYATDVILSSAATKGRLEKYGLVVLSNATTVESELKSALLGYAEGGGNLVIAGADGALLFAKELGFKCSEITNEGAVLQVYADGKRVCVQAPYVTIGGRGEIVEEMIKGESESGILTGNPPPMIYFEKIIPAAMKFTHGKGTVTVVPFDIGTAYHTSKTYQLKRFFDKVLSVYNRKLVCDKKLIEVNLATKGGVDYVHLISLLGDHESANVRTFDYIPPIGDIKVNFRTEKSVESVVLLPENKPIPFENDGNGISFILPELKIYSIIGVTYKKN